MEITQKLKKQKKDHNSLIFHAISTILSLKCPEFCKELSFSQCKTLKFDGKMLKIKKKQKNDHNSLNFHAISPIQSLKCPELRRELSFFGETPEKLMERARNTEKTTTHSFFMRFHPS